MMQPGTRGRRIGAMVLRVLLVLPGLWLTVFAWEGAATYLAAEYHRFQSNNVAGLDRYLQLEAATHAVPLAYTYKHDLALTEWQLGRKRVAQSLLTETALSRPTQPHAWDELVRLNVTGNTGGEDDLERYLRWSLRFGANEPDLILERARMAINLWPWQPQSWHARWFPSQVSRALQSEPQRVRAYAFLQRREDVLCGEEVSSDKSTEQAQWCKQVAELRQLCGGVLAQTRRVEEWCTRAEAYWRAVQ